MEKEIKAQWVEALRSGKYAQGKMLLRNENNTFCCLGVLADIQGADFESAMFPDGLRTSWLPNELAAGLSKYQMADLASMNDNGSDFPKIAAYIEANL